MITYIWVKRTGEEAKVAYFNVLSQHVWRDWGKPQKPSIRTIRCLRKDSSWLSSGCKSDALPLDEPSQDSTYLTSIFQMPIIYTILEQICNDSRLNNDSVIIICSSEDGCNDW